VRGDKDNLQELEIEVVFHLSWSKVVNICLVNIFGVELKTM
jgi:hypothetical protein